MLELCPMGQQRHPKTFHKLSWALVICFTQCGIDYLDEAIQFFREAVSLP
jgi:hypothetical protein